MKIYHLADVLKIKEKQTRLLEVAFRALVGIQELNYSPFLKQEETIESRTECLEHIIGELGMYLEDLKEYKKKYGNETPNLPHKNKPITS